MLKAYLRTKTTMMDLRDRMAALKADDDGAAMIEYAMIIGLVAVACIAILGTLGHTLNNAFTNVTNQVGTLGH